MNEQEKLDTILKKTSATKRIAIAILVIVIILLLVAAGS